MCAFVWFVELVADLFRLAKRADFENFWREALIELRKGNREIALLLFRDYRTEEISNSTNATRK